MADDAAWDTSKENFQPLKKGREAKILTEVAAMPTGERATKIKEERSAFWTALSTYEGTDPLEVWVRFIKWAEQTFHSGGRETEILPLLERCTRELREAPENFEKYKDDPRYLRVWVKYADLCKEPGDIFTFLVTNDIGQKHTLFYEAYAAFLEIKGAYTRAAQVYDRGVVMRAAPRERLKEKLEQFTHRMMRREQRKQELREAGGVLEDTEEFGLAEHERARKFGDARGGAGAGRVHDAENPGPGVVRGAVGGGVAGVFGAPSSSAGGAKRGRGMRGAAASAAASASGESHNAGDGGLEVYCDDENGAPTPVTGTWRNLPEYNETRKENSRAATTWAGQKLKQKRPRPGQAGAAPPAPMLEVYQDEDLTLLEEREAADAAAAAKELRKNATNANALRRRLDAGGSAGVESGLTVDPMAYHKNGNAAIGAFPRPAERNNPAPPKERLYAPFVPSDTTDTTTGGEVSYEEIRARQWEKRHGPVEVSEPEPGPIIASKHFATSTATTALVSVKPPRAASESPSSKQLVTSKKPPVSVGECDAPPSDSGSGVEGRGREPRSYEAAGSGLAPDMAPAAAAPPAAVVPAGLRWTATEGGTYGDDPTMTLCTKEAWGDIMSMFSDGLVSDTEAAKQKAATKTTELPVLAETDDAFEGLEIREDTQFGGFDIREDTELVPAVLPAAPRNPAARAPLAQRAPETVLPSPGQNSAAGHEEEPSEDGLDVYQDTALLDASLVAAVAGVGSAGSAPLGHEARTLRDGLREVSIGEPSANGANEFEVYDDEDNEFAADAENAAPDGHPSLRAFVPRSIADAAAAAAALQPLPLDLRSELGSENITECDDDDEGETRADEIARAETIMRNAQPAMELRGEDEFTVYADEADETAPPVRQEEDPSARLHTQRHPFLAPRVSGRSTPSFNPLFGLDVLESVPSSVHVGARAPPPTPVAPMPLAPTPTGRAFPTQHTQHKPGARGVTHSALVGYLVDPFDKQTFATRVANALPQLFSSQTTRAPFLLPGQTSLAAVELALKRGAKPGRFREKVTKQKQNDDKLLLGHLTYSLLSCAGTGADAVVFEGERCFDDENLDDDDAPDADEPRGAFAVKIQRANLATWEWIVSNRLAERVSEWDKCGYVRLTELYLVGGEPGGDVVETAAAAKVGVLGMPFGEHGTLQDALNSYLSVGEKMDEVLVMYYTIELLRVVETMHIAGVLHADIKPDNILLRNGGDSWENWAGRRPGSWREKGVSLIDFGCSIDLREYDPLVSFVGDVKTEGFRCPEMVNGTPWTFQSDLYQVAATVHTLLHGKYMRVMKGPGGYVPTAPAKRWWRNDLWTVFFATLLNTQTRALNDPPPLGQLRKLFENYLTTEGLGGGIREALMRQTVAMYDQAKAAEAKR